MFQLVSVLENVFVIIKEMNAYHDLIDIVWPFSTIGCVRSISPISFPRCVSTIAVALSAMSYQVSLTFYRNPLNIYHFFLFDCSCRQKRPQWSLFWFLWLPTCSPPSPRSPYDIETLVCIYYLAHLSF